jgi:multimeric flavodoxin WrbA
LNILGINGSPRKNWNTAILLEKTLEGARSQGASTELVHLYDLNYKGCKSCFSCKLKNGESYGKCSLNDELTPILRKIGEIDALILGSPIYLGVVTGEMHSFLERLIFPYLVYDQERSTLYPKKILSAFIYTMGAPEEVIKYFHIAKHIELNENFLNRIIGPTESLIVTDTLQFDDYSKYEASMFDEDAKKERQEKVFPQDCQKAYDIGVKIAQK